MQTQKRSHLALCVIVVGSLVSSSGCINVPQQRWAPTEELGSAQEGPNFLVCRGFEDMNYNGKLEPEEIQDMNPGWVKSGDEVSFVVRNSSSWKLKTQVELRDKETDKLIFRSPVKALAAESTWTTSTKVPECERETEVVAIFDVDYAPAHKAVFTVVP